MNMPPPPSSAISETSTLKSSDHLSPIVEKPPIYPSSQSQPESISLLLPVDSDTAAGPSNPTDGGVNPWLQISESSSAKQTRKRNEVVVGKDSSLAQKSETALKKRIGRTGGEKEKAKEDAEVEINTADVLKVTTDAGASKPVNGVKKAKKDLKGKGKETAPARGPKGVQESGNSKNGVEIPHGDSDESDSDSEIEEQEAAISQAKGKGKGPKAFEQRDLVARAFAGDNVVRVSAIYIDRCCGSVFLLK
jgi:U3 small nucleolar RNA-associated protein 14